MAPREIGTSPAPNADQEKRTRFTPRQFHPSVRRDILYRYLELEPKDEIADRYHTDVRTINVILADPEIREEHKRMMGLMSQNVAERLNVLGAAAVDTVRDTMQGKQESKLKLEAAKTVIDSATNFAKKPAEGAEAGDLAARVIAQIAQNAAIKAAIPVEEDAEIS
jgi:hypothetical protein